jgi:hypothetical protein
MKFFLLLLLSLPLFASAQLNGGTTYPINGVNNPPTSFGSIQDAADYLSINGVTGLGNVILELRAGYVASLEPAAGVLIDSIPGTSFSRRVIFRPGTGISADININTPGTAALTLQNVKYVTIDGRPGGVGTTGSLSFTNASTSATGFTGALLLVNSAKFNVVQYCSFTANATLATSSTVVGTGVVMFGDAGTFAEGNNGNKLYRCNINGNSSAHQLVVSKGSTASPAVANRADTIRGCNLFDNFSNVTANIAMNISFGNDRWYIDSNNIYQTSPRTYSLQALNTGIATVLNFTGEAHVIAYNNIGGSAPGATGSMVLGTGVGATIATGYRAIDCQHGENTFIFGNNIQNIALSYAASAGSFSNAMIFANIQYSTANPTNIGFNRINNISFTNNNGFVRLRTIYLRAVVTAATGTFSNVQPVLFTYNNILNNITGVGSGATGSVDLNGISCESASGANLAGGTAIGQFLAYDNKMTQFTATGANTGTVIRGILTFSSQGTNSTSGLGNYNEFIRDTISGFSTNSLSTVVTTPGIVGIAINSGLVDTSLIQSCDISNLANTNATDIANAVTGIVLTNGAWDVSRNRIYDLRNAATGATLRANLFGINIRGVNAPSTVYNNQISIGSGQNTNLQVYGILNNFSSPNLLNINYNTVLISGSPASGAANSAAIYRGSDTLAPVVPIVTPWSVVNNLCINRRSGGTGNHTAIFNQAIAAGNGFTADFNTLSTANTATAAQWGTTASNFATWKTNSSGDVYSYYAQNAASSSLSANPAQVNLANLFSNAAFETNGNLGIDSTKAECWLVAGKGRAIPTISGAFRSINPAFPTCIGATEFNPQVPAPCSFESAAPSSGGSSDYIFAGRTLMNIAWGAGGTLPSTVCVRYFSGRDVAPSSPNNNYSASYWQVTAANGSGYTYTPTINFSASERGRVPFTNTAVKQAFFNGVSWNYLGPTATANTATNPATSTIANITNQLGNTTALILTDVANPIPVDLRSFTATRNGSINQLTWITEQEQNSSRFVIEHSTDGRSFNPIAEVTAAGNSSTAITYNYTHTTPIRGVNYYRLRLIDRDNSFRYSPIRSVRNEGLANVSVYPNPVKAALSVSIEADKAITGQVVITDLNGRQVYTRTVNLVQGGNLLPVNTSALQAGTYILKVMMDEDLVVRKFTKQ